PFSQQDWQGLPASEQAARLEAFLAQERRLGFEPGVAPLIRVALIRRGEAAFQLVWTYHHILLDARSLGLLLNEVFAIYEGLREGGVPALPEPPAYREYIDWLQQQDWSKAEDFWRQRLKGFSSPTEVRDQRSEI